MVASLARKSATKAEEQIERLMQASGAKNMAALARQLDISPQALSKYKSKAQIPLAWAIQIAESSRYSLEWILDGEKGQQSCFVQEVRSRIKVDRLLQAADAKNDKELGHIIGVPASAITSARTQDNVPGEWIEDIAKKFDVSADWLFFGLGQMKREQPMATPQEKPTTTLPASSVTIEAELSKEREVNRELVAENRQLWKENGELKVKIGELTVQIVKLEGELDTARTMAKEYHEKLKARAAPEDTMPPEAIREAG